MKIERIKVGVIETNCYLVWNEETKNGFVVDPGGSAERIIGTARANGVTIQAVLLTHGHFDHILGIEDLCRDNPIPVFASFYEDELLNSGELNCTERILRRSFTVEADKLLYDDEEFEVAGIQLKSISTPGHTAGSMCYYISDSGILFSGDTLFLESVGRTDLPTGNGDDIRDSVNKLANSLPDETIVYPGHGPETSIGYEICHNPYITV